MIDLPQYDLNLIGTTCPMAFVKARVHLDQLPKRAITSIVFEDTLANEPLIRSIEALGHTILSQSTHERNIDDTTANPRTDHRPPRGTLQSIAVTIQVKI